MKMDIYSHVMSTMQKEVMAKLYALLGRLGQEDSESSASQGNS